MDRTEITVEVLQPKSIGPSALRELHALMAAAAAEARPHDPPMPFEVLSAMVGALPDYMEVTLFLARDRSDQAVGYAYLNRSRGGPDSRIVDLQMFADPERRQRGTAAAMLEAVCTQSEERGHEVLRVTTTAGIGWGEDLCRGLEGHRALERRTWRLPLADVDRDQTRLICAQAAERARGYSVEEVSGSLPDEVVDDAVELLEFLTEELHGDISPEEPRITVAKLRQLENAWRAMGQQRRWMFVRHDSSGTLAGVVDGMWNPATPDVIVQDNTVVRPEFRGRSLALWMKAAMLDKLLEEWTEAREIRTTSTFPNLAMDSVDERLGFLPYVRYTVWHVDLKAVKDWLNSGRR